ncbi:MAG: polysaccharide biosynthesis/export family protein, partial [Marinirhabdus sp.]
FEPSIEPNDILNIDVTGPDARTLIPYIRSNNRENIAVSSNAGLQGYLVSKDGTIKYPGLGKVAVGGKTRSQVEAQLSEMLLQYLKGVVVDVRIMNFKVTVMGEVARPGVFPVQNERITLPEALALAGDLTPDGKRGNITVIRNENGRRNVSKIDITRSDFFNGPYYFLKQNDVVYVEPTLKGVKKSGFVPDMTSALSLTGALISLVVIAISL